MRDELLAPEVMKTLVLTKDMKEFLERLSQTTYRDDIGEGRKSLKATELERIFNQSFMNRLERIIRVCPEDLSEFLRTYYYMRLEIDNLKRILRGKFSKLPIDRVKEFLVPIEPYRSVAFEELLTAEKLEDLIDLLRGTPYAPLEESLVLCQEYDALWPMEVELNYIYVEAVQGVLSKIPPIDRSSVGRMVELETDVENLLLAIEWKGAEKTLPSPEIVFLHVYGFSPEIVEEFIEGKDLGKAIGNLPSPYAKIFKPALENDVALVKTNLRRHIYEMAGRGRLRNDFGFPCIMSYLISCEAEKGDLTAIAWGKEREVEPKRILIYSILPAYAS
jgi:vacuolar-type H+-ATPase subunit C/Vma6